jgi:hypothetical protein
MVFSGGTLLGWGPPSVFPAEELLDERIDLRSDSGKPRSAGGLVSLKFQWRLGYESLRDAGDPISWRRLCRIRGGGQRSLEVTYQAGSANDPSKREVQRWRIVPGRWQTVRGQGLNFEE